jgi:hypothetical protein
MRVSGGKVSPFPSETEIVKQEQTTELVWS